MKKEAYPLNFDYLVACWTDDRLGTVHPTPITTPNPKFCGFLLFRMTMLGTFYVDF